jgi:hypothetical protein
MKCGRIPPLFFSDKKSGGKGWKERSKVKMPFSSQNVESLTLKPNTHQTSFIVFVITKLLLIESR